MGPSCVEADRCQWGFKQEVEEGRAQPNRSTSFQSHHKIRERYRRQPKHSPWTINSGFDVRPCTHKVAICFLENPTPAEQGTNKELQETPQPLTTILYVTIQQPYTEDSKSTTNVASPWIYRLYINLVFSTAFQDTSSLNRTSG